MYSYKNSPFYCLPSNFHLYWQRHNCKNEMDSITKPKYTLFLLSVVLFIPLKVPRFGDISYGVECLLSNIMNDTWLVVLKSP